MSKAMRAERQQEKSREKNRFLPAKWILTGFVIVLGVWALVVYLNTVLENQMRQVAWSKKKWMMPTNLVVAPSKDRKPFNSRPESGDILVMRRLLTKLVNDSKTNFTSKDAVMLNSYTKAFSSHWARMLATELRNKRNTTKWGRDWARFSFWPTVYVMGAAKTSSSFTWRMVTSSANLCGACCHGGPKGSLKRCGAEPCKELWPLSKGHKNYLKHFGSNPKCHLRSIDAHIEHGAPFIPDIEDEMPFAYVDGTPMLSIPNASSGLRKLMPEYIAKKAKFVLLVREPISRALSAYNHYNSNSSKNLTVAKFQEAFEGDMARPKMNGGLRDLVGSGMYQRHLLHWFRAFSRKQFLVVEYARLIQGDTVEELGRIARFLGAEAEGMIRALRDEKRKKRSLLKPLEIGDIPCDKMKEYDRFFATHNQGLYSLLEKTKGDAPPEQGDIEFQDVMLKCGGRGCEDLYQKNQSRPSDSSPRRTHHLATHRLARAQT